MIIGVCRKKIHSLLFIEGHEKNDHIKKWGKNSCHDWHFTIWFLTESFADFCCRIFHFFHWIPKEMHWLFQQHFSRHLPSHLKVKDFRGHSTFMCTQLYPILSPLPFEWTKTDIVHTIYTFYRHWSILITLLITKAATK